MSRRVTGAAALVLLLWVCMSAHAAADEPVTATFLPAAVSLEPGASLTVRLQVDNPSSGEVRVGRARVIVSGVRLTTDELPVVVPAGGRSNISFTVKARPKLSVTTTAVVDLPVRAASGTLLQTATATLSVTPTNPIAASPPVEVSAALTSGGLNELQSVEARITVRNTTPRGLVATCIAVLPPDGIAVDAAGGSEVPEPDSCTVDGPPTAAQLEEGRAAGVWLPGGSSRVFRFDVSVPDRVRPDSDKILFAVDVARADGIGRAQRVLVSADVTPSIFGSSALLVALGIPSLLLAPGFIFFLCLRGVRQAFGYADARWPWGDVKSPLCILLAILVSIGATVLVAVLSQLFGEGTDVTAFSLGYVFTWWAGAAVLGAVIGVVASIVQKQRTDDATPKAWEDWHELLDFLARNDLGPTLKSGTLESGDGLVLALGNVGGAEVWVTPRIQVKTADDATLQAIEGATTAQGMRDAVIAAEDEGLLTDCGYLPATGVPVPTKVAADTVVWSPGVRQAAVFVEEL